MAVLYSMEFTLTLANPTAMDDVSLAAQMKACPNLSAELAALDNAAFRLRALNLYNATSNAVLVAKTAAVGATYTTQIGGSGYPSSVELIYPPDSAVNSVGLAAAAGATVLVRADFVVGLV